MTLVAILCSLFTGGICFMLGAIYGQWSTWNIATKIVGKFQKAYDAGWKDAQQSPSPPSDKRLS